MGRNFIALSFPSFGYYDLMPTARLLHANGQFSFHPSVLVFVTLVIIVVRAILLVYVNYANESQIFKFQLPVTRNLMVRPSSIILQQ